MFALWRQRLAEERRVLLACRRCAWLRWTFALSRAAQERVSGEHGWAAWLMANDRAQFVVESVHAMQRRRIMAEAWGAWQRAVELVRNFQ